IEQSKVRLADQCRGAQRVLAALSGQRPSRELAQGRVECRERARSRSAIPRTPRKQVLGDLTAGIAARYPLYSSHENWPPMERGTWSVDVCSPLFKRENARRKPSGRVIS